MFPKNFFKVICYVKIERLSSNFLLKLEIIHQKYEFLITITGYWKCVFLHYWTFSIFPQRRSVFYSTDFKYVIELFLYISVPLRQNIQHGVFTSPNAACSSIPPNSTHCVKRTSELSLTSGQALPCSIC